MDHHYHHDVPSRPTMIMFAPEQQDGDNHNDDDDDDDDDDTASSLDGGGGHHDEDDEDDEDDVRVSDIDQDHDSTCRPADPYRVSRTILKRISENDPDYLFLELEEGYLTEWFQLNLQAYTQQFLEALRHNTTIQHVSVSGEFFGALVTTSGVAAVENVHNHNTAAAALMNNNNNNSNNNTWYYDRMFFNTIGQIQNLKTLEISEVIDFDGYSLSIDILHQLLHTATNLQRLTLRFVELCSAASSGGSSESSQQQQQQQQQQQTDGTANTDRTTTTTTTTTTTLSLLDASLQSIGVDTGADENNPTNRMLFQSFQNHPSLEQVSFAQLRLQQGIVGINPLIKGLATIPRLRTLQLHMAVHTLQRQEQEDDEIEIRHRHRRLQEQDDMDDDSDEDDDQRRRRPTTTRTDRYKQQAKLKPIGMIPTLRSIELSSMNITDEQSMLQALHNNRSLKDLFLASMELSFSGWATLAHMIRRRRVRTTRRTSTRTTTTRRTGSRRSKEQEDDEQQQQQELGGDQEDGCDCVALESLRLDNMTGLDDDTIQLLCHALKACKPNGTTTTAPTLQQLRLYNVMDMSSHKGWKSIADMIASNTTLQLLSLENCQGMDDDAIIGIANIGLANNATLKTLELQVFAGHCTRFSQKVGQKALLDVLKNGQNITLETLYTQAPTVSSNTIESQTMFYLGLNRTGLRQYVLGKHQQQLDHNNNNANTSNTTETATSQSIIVRDFWKLLQPHMNDLDILFYVLSTNPPFVLSCLQGL